jgi:WhiB family transcriptional regulator, redox-sensing transcriptional regulator
MEWPRYGACRDEDPELFFPVGSPGQVMLQVEKAKAVCARCPVVVDCLAYAVNTGQESGVWGGLSEAERRWAVRRSAAS